MPAPVSASAPEYTRPGRFYKLGKGRPLGERNLYYEVHGSGPIKILFIMGYTVPTTGWLYQIEFFKTSTDFQICCCDNVGSGSSDVPIGFYSIKEMARDAFELLHHLGWTKNVHVVGISMGGMISLELMLHCPTMFESCMLVSTHAGRTLPPISAFWNMPRIILQTVPRRKVDLLQSILFPPDFLAQPAPQGSKFKTMKEYTFYHLATRERGIPLTTLTGAVCQLYAIFRYFVEGDRLSQLCQTDIRFMVLTGTYDKLVKPVNSLYLADSLKCAIEVLTGGGHAIPEQNPEWFNDFLVKHVTNTMQRATVLPIKSRL